MLDNPPDSGTDIGSQLDDDDEIVCAACEGTITRTRWAISRNGDHEHTVFNPAGQIFRVVCFKEAPGTQAVGVPTDEFTWFKGHTWQLALCRTCNTHIGWQDSGGDIFFGLIKPKLSTRRS